MVRASPLPTSYMALPMALLVFIPAHGRQRIWQTAHRLLSAEQLPCGATAVHAPATAASPAAEHLSVSVPPAQPIGYDERHLRVKCTK